MKSELYEKRNFPKTQTQKNPKHFAGKRQLQKRGLYGKGVPDIWNLLANIFHFSRATHMDKVELCPQYANELGLI